VVAIIAASASPMSVSATPNLAVTKAAKTAANPAAITIVGLTIGGFLSFWLSSVC
jgi:hypothetical protein